MKAWVKRRWINALRSGEYEQGVGNLAFLDEGVTAYCCLGVLCDLSPVSPVREFADSSLLRFDGSSLTLPPKVQIWAGLNTDDPKVTVDEEIQSLSYCNDDMHLSLSRIAEVIDESIPVEVEHHVSPLPCTHCGHVGQCRTASGRKTGRHSVAAHLDDIWSAAHMALDLDDIDIAVAKLVILDRINEGITS